MITGQKAGAEPQNAITYTGGDLDGAGRTAKSTWDEQRLLTLRAVPEIIVCSRAQP
jgi:hypothetical protein